MSSLSSVALFPPLPLPSCLLRAREKTTGYIVCRRAMSRCPPLLGCLRVNSAIQHEASTPLSEEEKKRERETGGGPLHISITGRRSNAKSFRVPTSRAASTPFLIRFAGGRSLSRQRGHRDRTREQIYVSAATRDSLRAHLPTSRDAYARLSRRFLPKYSSRLDREMISKMLRTSLGGGEDGRGGREEKR